MQLPLLSLIIFLPIVGSLLLLLVPATQKSYIKYYALAVTVIILIFSFIMYQQFDLNNVEYGHAQLTEKYRWFSTLPINYYVGVDSISLPFVLLTALISIVCVLASIGSITAKEKEYYALFLLLESLIMGTFLALDTVLFYIFFEASLIPLFIIVGVWGAENKIYAAFKFFLYTFAGSVFFLIGIIYVINVTGSSDMLVLPQMLMQWPIDAQIILWVLFFLGFAIKIPMWPVHTWLPDAHVQAPTAGSIILAAILLKFGAYGLIRFSIVMLPEASYFFKNMIFLLSCIAIIYASLLAFAQTNIKKLIAYSSIAHMGYVTLGIFALNFEGLQGAIMQMVSHGLISGALFLTIGVLYERTHTKDIDAYGGMAAKMPGLASIFMLLTLGSVGLPGTSGFVGEILSLMGLFKVNLYYCMIAALGMVLGAVYMLKLYRKIMFGSNREYSSPIYALQWQEIVAFTPLIILILLLGIYPSLLLNITKPTILSIFKLLG